MAQVDFDFLNQQLGIDRVFASRQHLLAGQPQGPQVAPLAAAPTAPVTAQLSQPQTVQAQPIQAAPSPQPTVKRRPVQGISPRRQAIQSLRAKGIANRSQQDQLRRQLLGQKPAEDRLRDRV